MYSLIPLASACVFANSVEFNEQYTEFLLCAYHDAKYHRWQKKRKKQISVYLQGGLIGKTDMYANNCHSVTYPFGFQTLIM